jgi:plastocyanin
MEIREHRPEQADLTDPVRHPIRLARGPLGQLTLIAFFGYAFLVYAVFFYALFVARAFIPPIVIEASLILLAAIVLATNWRYAPYLGAIVALLTLIDPIFQPHNLYVYTHPGQSNYEFSLLVLIVAFGLISLASCMATIIARRRGQGTQGREAGLPRHTAVSLSGFAGLILGMILLSIVVTIVPQTSAANTGLNGQPVIHMTATSFAQDIVLVPKGKSLLVVNDSSVEHILQNGAWDANGSAHSQAEDGAPTLHNIDIISEPKSIGPFTTAGVYHIYCTLHPGMNLTIVVQ